MGATKTGQGRTPFPVIIPRLVAALALAALAAGLAAGRADAHVYVYTVESRGDVQADVDEFAEIATETLAHPRGWGLRGAIEFQEISSNGQFRLILASPSAVAAAAPVCSAQWSCRVGDQVLINDERWRTGTDAWTGSLEDYRRYAINHEVGHWLGFGHHSCPRDGALSPVMQQQSISLEGCRPMAWPLLWEQGELADEEGLVYPPWPLPIPRWFWDWQKWYLGHDEFSDRRRDDDVRPEAAPARIPDWAWRRLRVTLGTADAVHIHESGVGPQRPWPVPIPRWYWEWVRWYLGEGEFVDTPFRSSQTRPDAAPARIPDWAWTRTRYLLALREE
jgi:hypothetical protein